MVSDNNYIYTYNFRIGLFLPNEMIKKKNNFFLIIIFILLVSSLISAFVIEYGLGHKPCKLCLYQRYPYYISILLLMSIFIIKKNIRIHFLVLSIVFLFGALVVGSAFQFLVPSVGYSALGLLIILLIKTLAF